MNKWTLFLITVILSAFLIYFTSYLENTIFKRQIIQTYTIYCLYLALSTTFLSKVSIWQVVKSFAFIFITGIMFVIVVVIAGINIDNFIYIVVAMLYAALLLILLYGLYKINLTKKLLLSILFACAITALLLYMIDSYQTYYYGISLICGLTCYNVVTLALISSKKANTKPCTS